jgi:hypothetical protein
MKLPGKGRTRKKDKVHQAGNEWFPAEGLWLVEKEPGCTRQRRVLRLGQLPKPYPYVSMARHLDLIAGVIVDSLNGKPISPYEIAEKILLEIAKSELKRKRGNK